MRNGFLFFIGLFAALTLSWAGVALWPNWQLGLLKPFYDQNDEKAYPQRTPGIAAEGRMVYDDLGCAACHTQQVRRPDLGSDKARGWGDRQSVARDYIYDTHVELGAIRVGPDLANLGARKPAYDRDDLYKLLYAGVGAMPSYKFLFEQRVISSNRQPADDAITLYGPLAPPPGTEIVPTHRARRLVEYLLSLSQSYEYPEATPVEPAAQGKEGEKK
ncbi:MAG TPA: cbb3-type cytochrome c oxidase subunit II [Opitutus sp.]|nr:cbb3-type cytochrome c oxidase subunit II [Opitutus sp.]